MRAWLKRGKLVPPFSPSAAKARLVGLKLEIERIKTNLDLAVGDSTSVNWQTSAERALKLFQSEAQQLEGWLAANDSDTFEQDIKEFWES